MVEIKFWFWFFSYPLQAAQPSWDNQSIKESAIELTNRLYFTAYVNGTAEGRKREVCKTVLHITGVFTSWRLLPGRQEIFCPPIAMST